MVRKQQWRSFEEAREFVRGLALRSSGEWREWSQSGARPDDIPAAPQSVYKDQWRGMADWLGTGRRATGTPWRPFEEAREYVRGLGLKNQTEWKASAKTAEKPNDIPASPISAYKDQWRGMADWLGTGRRYGAGWRPFEEAREYVRGLRLQDSEVWKAWAKTAEKPNDIPASPIPAYKDQWRGMADWLGTGRRAPGKPWRPFEEAREFVRRVGLQSIADWTAWAKTDARPEDIPASPTVAYNDQWRGFPDWLGYTPTNWYRPHLLALLEDLRPHLPYLEEAELYAILQQGGVMPMLRRNFGGAAPLDVIRDLRENEGHEIQKALEAAENEELGAAGDPVAGLAEDLDRPYQQELPLDEVEGSAIGDGGGMPTLVSGESMRVVDELARLHYGIDSEVAEYLVESRVAALWSAYINGGVDAVADALVGEGGYYFGLIRSRFTSELEAVENLPVPEGWAFSVDGQPVGPNFMQRRTAHAVLTRRRVINYSGVGAGKTLSAILAARVADRRHTLVITNKATVAGWRREIGRAFPDSVVHTRPGPPAPERFNFMVLNYERFQIQSRNDLVRSLADLGIDFVVLDEVQLVKQRDEQASYRRQAVAALLSILEEHSEGDLCVLGMSATLVLNTLLEGRKLLEVVTGREFSDLNTTPTVNNVLALHRALTVNGLRYRPNYKQEIDPKMPRIVANELLEDLQTARGVLPVEQLLLPYKLKEMRPYLKPGTIIYSYYTRNMIRSIREFVEGLGYSTGLYTGDDKSGLEPFLAGKADVLIGSKPVGTGLDGLQYVCQNIVIVSLPWTGAEYEQLIGRVRRQGSTFKSIRMVIPQVVLDNDGAEWSWDKGRMNTIEFKRTLSDAVVDGRVPEVVRISPTELLKHSRKALEEWIARVKGGGALLDYERAQLKVPLPPELQRKLTVTLGDFSKLNNRWVTSNSATVHERLQADPSEWYLYHTLYREARQGWPEVPAAHIADHLRGRPDLRVGDFGCGEGLLANALGEGHEVVGLDHIAIDEQVIACDMAQTPLEDESLGAAGFALSLMGRNWSDYLKEAHRTLKPFGLLLVVEPARRWVGAKLLEAIEANGFDLIGAPYQRGDFLYVRALKRTAPQS